MKQEIKTDWLAALRSGKYKQGKGRLYNKVDRSFCCLGVLADVAGLEIGSGGTDLVDAKGDGLDYKPFAHIGVPRSEQSKLWGMNDGRASRNRDVKQYSFLEIADYIEKTL